MFWRKRRGERERIARDVKDELQFHQDMRASDAHAPSVQRTASETALVQLAQSRDRRLRLWTFIDDVRADIVNSARRLRRSPAFTTGAVGIVALGLGANVAVFGLANAMYFRPLPFPEADRLTRIQEYSAGPDGAIRWTDGSAPTMAAARANGMFKSVAAFRYTSASLRADGRAARHVAVGEVTAGWGDVTALRPAIGRLFSPQEESEGDAATVVVISHHLWQLEYGGRADILGAAFRDDAKPRTIVGVLPQGFRFPYEIDAWWPRSVRLDERGFFIYGRLNDGVTLEQANARLASAAPQLSHDYPLVVRGLIPRARMMRDFIIDGGDRIVLLLAWAVALLLLIAAGNAAMLMTTRLVARERELAMRLALGCSRARQLRMLTLEAILIFLGGAAVGLGLAAAARPLVATVLPNNFDAQLALADLPTDWRVVVFTLTIAVVSGGVFGMLSGWRATRSDISSVASAASRTIGGARRWLSALIFSELAMAAALLCVAAIVAGALCQLETHDPGIRTDRVLTLQFDFAGERRLPERQLHLLDELEGGLRAIPGVDAVGSATVNPLCCGDWGSRVTQEGVVQRQEDAPLVQWNVVSPGFFDTLGIRMVEGRAFDVRDAANAEFVSIVDQRMAARLWPGERSVVGRRLKRGGTDSPYPWTRVVGVAAMSDHEGDYPEQLYFPYLQHAGGPSTETLHVWAHVHDTAGAMAAMRAVVARVDPGLAIQELTSMNDIRRSSLSQQRTGTGVAAAFAAAGALLALFGIYSLVAFVVAGERREMGIRIALGALPRTVMWMTLARLARTAVPGALVGGAVAWLAEPRLVDAVGAAPQSHGWQMCLVIAALMTASLAAAWWPAQQILKLDPREALQR